MRRSKKSRAGAGVGPFEAAVARAEAALLAAIEEEEEEEAARLAAEGGGGSGEVRNPHGVGRGSSLSS